MPYDIYPVVDENYAFPPEIRQKLSEANEFKLLFDAKAPLDSPVLTGVPKVPNLGKGASTQQAVNSKFVADTIADYETKAVVASRGRHFAFPDIATMVANKALFNNGDVMAIGRYQYSTGILHRASTWIKSSGVVSPSSVIWLETSDRAGMKTAAQSVYDSANVADFAIYRHQEFRNVITSHCYIWDGGYIVPKPGLLAKKSWAQWNYGPAPRGAWWTMPMDTFNDPYGICDYGNGFTAPASGWYRCSGQFGYQQSSREQRMMAGMYSQSGADHWTGLPMFMWNDTNYPWSLQFYSDKGDKWQHRIYHSDQNDYYMINGANNNAERPETSRYFVEFLGIAASA